MLWGRVAMVMMGQAFRSKYMYYNSRSQCTSGGTLEAQRILAKNHHDYVIHPIVQQTHKTVDIFLSYAPCTHELDITYGPQQSEFIWSPSFEPLSQLFEMYNTQDARVHSVVNMSVCKKVKWTTQQCKGDMFNHIGEMYDHVSSVTKGSAYEYYIVLRYDVALQSSILSFGQFVDNFRFVDSRIFG